MEIRINGQTADITIDHEKTVGEILASIDEWLGSSGYYLSGLCVDGNAVDTVSMNEVFLREIEKVKLLEIDTIPLAALVSMSLGYLPDDIDEYEKTSFQDRSKFLDNWKQRSYVQFISGQMPELFSLYVSAFSQEGVSPETLRSITQERQREVTDPAAEGVNLQPVLEEICARLTDLPLDIQTGKDMRAAQTIQIFSGIGEKILRIVRQLDIQGYLPETANDEKPYIQTTEEFGNVLKDLLDAYERHDTVLVGDLAEYEIAPKLMELYEIIKNSRRPAGA
jgi:hypothetical protein